MSIDTLPQRYDMIGFEENLQRVNQEPTPLNPGRRTLIVGGGYNSLHMYENGGLDHVDYDVADIAEPRLPVAEDRLHIVDTPEGQAELIKLVEAGTFRSVYGSVIPALHMEFIETYLEQVAAGNVEFVVVSKPAVETLEEMIAVDMILKNAVEAVQERLGNDYDAAKNPLLLIHGHYSVKGAWRAFENQLPGLIEQLGRPVSMAINIQEAKTDDDRVGALSGGIIRDLGTHASTLAQAAFERINETGRYRISNSGDTEIRRFRHEDSKITDETVETGFIVKRRSTLTSHEEGDEATTHSFDIYAGAAKGTHNRKDVIFTFEKNGVQTEVTMNLSTNTLDVPDSAAYLFPVTQYDDNGYGHIVEEGFNGDTPSKSFQSWEKNRNIIKWVAFLGRLGLEHTPMPYIHAKGVPLEEFEPLLLPKRMRQEKAS
jgi:hypothetical protein